MPARNAAGAGHWIQRLLKTGRMRKRHTNNERTMTSFAMNNRWCCWATKLGLHCLLFVAALRCEAQNLVPNHSFEVRDTCSGLNQVHYPDTGPLGWFSGGWTPDYYQTCLGSGATFGVPLSYWCDQYPQDGENHVGMLTFDEAFGGREYFMTELVAPLLPGQTYYASFYANAGWGGPQQQMWLASSGIGMLFTMQARQWELGDPVPMGVAYAHVHESGILADTVNWVLVSGSFVADSAYQYVMIGNQFGNAETDTVQFADLSTYARAYTLVDNVCVSADPMGCPMATTVVERPNEPIFIYPNPAADLLVASGLVQGARISIVDAVGKEVWQGTAHDTRVEWNVAAWARGAYVMRVAGTGRSFKFVLME